MKTASIKPAKGNPVSCMGTVLPLTTTPGWGLGVGLRLGLGKVMVPSKPTYNDF